MIKASLVALGLLGLLAGCAEGPEKVPDRLVALAPELTGCQSHIELKGAEFWAKELGQSETQVLGNHRINLWERPDDSGSKGAKVGEMRVGSRAVILDETPEAYRVRSPLDQSVGWVSKIQVARTLHQDMQTRKSCTPTP